MNYRDLVGFARASESFGGMLYTCRQRLSLSQTEIATRSGISVGYYSELENSKRLAPPRSTALRIAYALQLGQFEAELLVGMGDEERLGVYDQTQYSPQVRQLVASIRAAAPLLRPDLVESLQAKIWEACM